MSFTNTGRRSCLLAALIMLCAGGSLFAVDDNEIGIKWIGGNVCARCTLIGPQVSVPANVVIDLGSRVPLVIQEKAAELVGLTRDGKVSLDFGHLMFADFSAQPDGLRSLEDLTREYAQELEEIPAVAVLGLPAFSHYMPQLDMAEGVLRLLPATEGEGDHGDLIGGEPAGDNVIAIPYEEEGHSYWLAGVGPDNFPLRVRFSMSQYDTIIDSTAADLAGAAGGNLDQLLIGSLDVTRYVALRPEDLSGVAAPRPDVIIGTNLLASFRLTIDIARQRMFFDPRSVPAFPADEQAFFIARAEEDADAVERFLTEHRDSRLATDAGYLLVRLRLDEYPVDPAAIGKAVAMLAEAAKPERRAQSMVELANTLLSGSRDDRYALATDVLNIGLKYAPDDLNARAGSDIQALLGMIALRRDDLKQARRHLLSAAFGIPRDAMLNLYLGELYERTAKPARAWSRYVQAILADGPPTEAYVGLDRLNNDAAFRSRFNMVDAQQLLEGRVTEFHPASRFERDAENAEASPVHLVELFTCMDKADTLAAELAFGGLAEYLEHTNAAVVAYHLNVPQPDPLASKASASRAAFYRVDATPRIVFDGAKVIAGGGGEGETEQLFAMFREASRGAASQWQISGSARVAGDSIAGEIELNGPAESGGLRLFALLCERIVMAPGGNGLLLHADIARYDLSPEGGFAVPAGAGARKFTVEAKRGNIESALTETLKQTEESAGVEFIMTPTYVDPALSAITVILQDERNKQVFAARTIPITVQDGGQP